MTSFTFECRPLNCPIEHGERFTELSLLRQKNRLKSQQISGLIREASSPFNPVPPCYLKALCRAWKIRSNSTDIAQVSV